jgi:adenylate kinase family enzyme
MAAPVSAVHINPGRTLREQAGVDSVSGGFVLDGYRRTPHQAESLRRMLAAAGGLEHRPVTVWLEAL